VDEFGGLSQTDTHMSTERLAFGNVEKPDVLPMSDYYKRALPIFEDMINTCQSKNSIAKINSCYEKSALSQCGF